jgi:hypothetical protein
MSDINWDERVRVQLFEPIGIKNYQIVEESVVKWDGITLANAIRRCMRLSAAQRAKVSILTPSAYYDASDIEALSQRLPE